MEYEVVFEGVIIRLDDPEVAPERADLEGLLDRMMSELPKHGARGALISASSDADVEVTVKVDALTLEVANTVGGSQIRAAAHAAGLGTPGWDVRWCKTNVVDAAMVADEDLVDA